MRAPSLPTRRRSRICANCATRATPTGSRARCGRRSRRWDFAACCCPRVWAASGLGYVEGGVIMEEIGRNLTPSPFLSTALLGATALLRDGNSARNKELLPKLAAGDLLLALAVDERTKHAPSATALKAERSGNGFAPHRREDASSSTAMSPTFSSSRRAAPARRARPTASRSFSSTPRRRGSTPSAP